MTQVRWWTGVATMAVFFGGWGAGAEVRGQEAWVTLPGPGLTLVAGGFSYDVGETGSGSVVGIRADFPLSGHVTLEPGLERLAWDPQGATGSETRWMADFALRGRYGVGRLTPYGGGNLGFLVNLSEDRATDDKFVEVAYGAHGGVRLDVLPRVGVVGEVRARWFDRGDARWILYTAGVSWRL